MVLASVVEMENRQRIHCAVTSKRQYTNLNNMSESMHMLPESIPTPSYRDIQTPIGTPLSAATSPTLTGIYSPATQHSFTASPESSFSAPTPSSSSTDLTRCPLCPALFTGSARDRKSNLRRHMRTTRDHGNAVGLLCTVPGCGAEFSRSDNLGKHFKTVHGEDAGGMLRRAGARKRRRVSEGDGLF